MAGPERSGDEAEKDLYPADADFGRQAAEDEERLARGETPARHEEPRAGSKAEPEPKDPVDPEPKDPVDEASEESFPASDPPSSSGSTAGG